MIKLVIADDHFLIREGFKTLLKKQSEIQLVGEAENGRELLAVVASTAPDVVITDIQMPEQDGITATRLIKEQHPAVGIIALSMFNENHLVIDMFKAGAKGYLVKNTDERELIDAIRSVHAGGSYFCNDTSLTLARLIDQHKLNPYEHTPEVHLTEKEIGIIRLICQEYSSKQIAPLVKLTKRTVENYREKIQEKVGAQNVVGIVLYALRNGLFSLDKPSS